MLRTIAITLLILLALLPAFRLGIIYGWYALNKAYIAENFCENIDQPELLCSGKCYVTDLIEQQDPTSELPLPFPGVEKLSPIIPLLPDSRLLLAPAHSGDQTRPPTLRSDHYRFLYTSSLLKPPRQFVPRECRYFVTGALVLPALA